MPCDSRIVTQVEFGAQTDPLLLAKALQALGYTVNRLGSKQSDGFTFYKSGGGDFITGQFRNGRFAITADTAIEQNQFKRAYSAEVVKSAAQRFGWQAKQAEPNKFQVQRRS